MGATTPMMLFLYAFLAGLTAVLAPCIWPVALTYLGLTIHDRMARVGPLSIAFVLSFGLVGSIFQLYDRVGPIPFWLVSGIAGVCLLTVAILLGLSFYLPSAHRAYRMLPLVAGTALGVAWSPCWGSVLGSISVIVREGNLFIPGMILLAAYAAGAAAVVGFGSVIVRDLIVHFLPVRFLPIVRFACIAFIALAGTGFLLNAAPVVSRVLIPVSPFVFFSL